MAPFFIAAPRIYLKFLMQPESEPQETACRSPPIPPLALAVVRFILPFALGFLYFGVCYTFLPHDEALILGGLMLAYLFPPAGKETVIPLGIALGFPWQVMTLSIALVDIFSGMFMALNFDVAVRFPLLGPWILRFLERREKFLDRRPWLEHLYFTGVALFVLFPFQGTGGVGASVVGRILGLPPLKVLVAIGIGAFSGCLLIALGSELFISLIRSYPLVGWGLLVTVILSVLAVFLLLRYRKGAVRDR